jgi:hypothetical protein
VGETVFHPGTDPNYVWPPPMVNVRQTPNPTPLYVKGNNTGPNSTTAGFGDYNKPPDSYSMPYSANGFQATQLLQWECPNLNGGNYTLLVSSIPINRRVFLDTDNKWKYEITKSGYVNTVVLPNQ